MMTSLPGDHTFPFVRRTLVTRRYALKRSSVRRNGAIRRICGAEGALQSSSAICLFVLSEKQTKFVL